MNQLTIREERSTDTAAIRAVHDSAFGRNAEGRLVDRLAKAVRSPYSAAAEAWMALQLQPSNIFAYNAEVNYPTAFAIVD